MIPEGITEAVERIEADKEFEGGCGTCGGIEKHEAHCPYRQSWGEGTFAGILIICLSVTVLVLLGVLIFK